MERWRKNVKYASGEQLTSTWREIVYPSGKTISQDNRYKTKAIRNKTK